MKYKFKKNNQYGGNEAGYLYHDGPYYIWFDAPKEGKDFVQVVIFTPEHNRKHHLPIICAHAYKRGSRDWMWYMASESVSDPKIPFDLLKTMKGSWHTAYELGIEADKLVRKELPGYYLIATEKDLAACPTHKRGRIRNFLQAVQDSK